MKFLHDCFYKCEIHSQRTDGSSLPDYRRDDDHLIWVIKYYILVGKRRVTIIIILRFLYFKFLLYIRPTTCLEYNVFRIRLDLLFYPLHSTAIICSFPIIINNIVFIFASFHNGIILFPSNIISIVIILLSIILIVIILYRTVRAVCRGCLLYVTAVYTCI